MGSTASAQDNYKAFEHLSAGIGFGTTGIEIQFATPLSRQFALRTGFSFMPGISKKFNVDFDNSTEDFLRRNDGPGYYEDVDVKGKLHTADWKVLADSYPFRNSTFHLTAGFFVGRSKIVTAKSTSEFLNEDYWGNSGPELGSNLDTYTLVSDDQGVIKADVKINSFKPYIGVGYELPFKKVGLEKKTDKWKFAVDAGVLIWGGAPTLKVSSDDINLVKDIKNVPGKKGDYVSKFKKLPVYPVINIGVVYHIL
jgi:hypothetical protein